MAKKYEIGKAELNKEGNIIFRKEDGKIVLLDSRHKNIKIEPNKKVILRIVDETKKYGFGIPYELIHAKDIASRGLKSKKPSLFKMGVYCATIPYIDNNDNIKEITLYGDKVELESVVCSPKTIKKYSLI